MERFQLGPSSLFVFIPYFYILKSIEKQQDFNAKSGYEK